MHNSHCQTTLNNSPKEEVTKLDLEKRAHKYLKSLGIKALTNPLDKKDKYIE
jgi:hypothetical protein